MTPFLIVMGNALLCGVVGGTLGYLVAGVSADRDIRKRHGYTRPEFRALKKKWRQEDRAASRALAGKESDR